MKGKRWRVTAEKFLSQEELNRLLDYLLRERDLALARGNRFQSVKNYYLIRGLLETGARSFEFCDLKESDFNGLKLNIRNGKGSKPRTIILTRSAAGLFNEWIAIKKEFGLPVGPHSPLFPSKYKDHFSTRALRKIVKKIFRAVGLRENLSTHSTRHQYCSMLLSSGKVGLGTARDNMGHSSIAVTDLYTHAVSNLGDLDLYSEEGTTISKKSAPSENLESSRSNIVGALLRKRHPKLRDPK